MIIQPKVRGFICTNAHPTGCAAEVQRQIDYVRAQGPISAAGRKVLVIGASTGYGLASRISAAFGSGAATLGVFLEKPGSATRTASAGYYNSAALQAAARGAGLYAEAINGDAFSDEIKAQTIAKIRADMGQVDLVVYSLAAPRRSDPHTGQVYQSCLKPIGAAVTRKTLDTNKNLVHEVTIEPATEEEIASTVKVMGGEDWDLWMDALLDAEVLAQGCKTVAYTYIGGEITWPLYGHATIGRAKEDLDRAAHSIDRRLVDIDGAARVAVLKAVVTQASSAIPIMPLYLSLLFRLMKERGVHEGCIEQIYGLFKDGLYAADAPLDKMRRYRCDGKELDAGIQDEVARLWEQATTENFQQIADYQGYRDDFLRLFGFAVPGIDYGAEVSPLVEL